MATTTQPISLPIGPNGQNIRGNLVTNSNGDAEWYQDGQPLPKFTSNKTSEYEWVPSPNCNAVLGTCPTQRQLELFYNDQTSQNNLNQARINTFNSPKGFNSPQLAKQLGLPKAKNAALPDQQTEEPTEDAPKPDPQETVPGVFEGIDVVEAFGGPKESAGSYNPNGREAWIYPTGIADNRQDYIKFNMISYGPRKGITPTGRIGKRTFGGATDSQVASGKTREILGTVILPIQPSITDQNLVDWQNDTMNALQAAGASIALQASGSNAAGAVEASIGQLVEKLGGDESIKQYLRYWAAGKAVGTNLFSRIAGATVNPNLELLFNGPQLRPFNFNFRLSPRSQGEADIVKGIIRFFKKGMSISRSANDLFLKTPNVFEIQYINGQTGKPHNSINKIKICALTNCGVDYTPDGSYATFYDNESTMTSYGLTLQFNELEPVFKDDYDDNQTSIGY